MQKCFPISISSRKKAKKEKSANVIPVVFYVMSCRAHAHITVNSIRKKKKPKISVPNGEPATINDGFGSIFFL